MSEEVTLPELEGYITVKDAAKRLGLAYKTVYEYVTEGRIKAKRAGDTILIPVEEVRNFKPNLAGRPRTTIPIWRISPEDNTLTQTVIRVQVRKGMLDAFKERLDEIRRRREHLFPGTIARYIAGSKKQQEMVEMMFVWRSSVIPDDATRKQALDEFRQALNDVVDWDTAQYEEHIVFMHA
ncbi:MAG TPA: helix-turn-helix domain-containing protein [Ktedonosporobacter sp.]|nr:helix-turn-helix domain-containing protein [Ktedonosporobacter sp.]